MDKIQESKKDPIFKLERSNVAKCCHWIRNSGECFSAWDLHTMQGFWWNVMILTWSEFPICSSQDEENYMMWLVRIHRHYNVHKKVFIKSLGSSLFSGKKVWLTLLTWAAYGVGKGTFPELYLYIAKLLDISASMNFFLFFPLPYNIKSTTFHLSLFSPICLHFRSAL